jgi:hypothetical protein
MCNVIYSQHYWKTTKKWPAPPPQYRNDVNRHSENVKNRLLLPWFIDDACYWTNQELRFRSHGKSSTSLNKRNFVEFLNVLKKLWSTSWESQRSTALCYWSEPKFANGFQASLMLALTEHLMVSLSTYKARASFNLFSKLKMSCTHLFLNLPKEYALLMNLCKRICQQFLRPGGI